jgi:P27 family predicted phage terminase small subunit
MRGRRPVATHLKILRGNPGKRAINKNEPLPVGDLVDPPEWLTESQKAGWNYAIENAPRGLLKKLDRSILVAWVVAEDIHRKAAAKVEQYGLIAKAPQTGTPIQSPWLPVLNKQAQILLRAAEQLGFTPSARSRVQVAPDSGRDSFDAWDAL